jgi:hypothetical protein
LKAKLDVGRLKCGAAEWAGAACAGALWAAAYGVRVVNSARRAGRKGPPEFFAQVLYAFRGRGRPPHIIKLTSFALECISVCLGLGRQVENYSAVVVLLLGCREI